MANISWHIYALNLFPHFCKFFFYRNTVSTSLLRMKIPTFTKFLNPLVKLPDNEEVISKAKELLQKNVLEIATKHIMMVELGTPLSEVCRLFYEHKLSKIPITQNGVLVGTISRGDTMRYLMKRLPFNTEHKTS